MNHRRWENFLLKIKIKIKTSFVTTVKYQHKGELSPTVGTALSPDVGCEVESSHLRSVTSFFGLLCFFFLFKIGKTILP